MHCPQKTLPVVCILTHVVFGDPAGSGLVEAEMTDFKKLWASAA